VRTFLVEYFSLRDFFRKETSELQKMAIHVKRLFMVTPFPVSPFDILSLCSEYCVCCYLYHSSAFRNQDVLIVVQSWLTTFLFVLLVQGEMELQLFTQCLLHQ